ARLLTRCFAAVTRSDRIDKDKVGHVEPRVGIVDKLVGRWEDEAVGAGRDDPRTERAEMEIGGCRTRTAVEDEGYGALRALPRRLSGEDRIGNVEDLARDGAANAFQRERARPCLVAERASGHIDRMLGGLHRRQKRNTALRRNRPFGYLGTRHARTSR